MLIGNRYELFSLIHQTPTTEIWDAIDTRNSGEVITVKILKVSETTNQLLVKELFKREADSLSRLKHDNIIKYVDSGLENGFFYIVTEKFEGQNLYSYLKTNQRISYEKKLKIILDVLTGLAEAHKNQVIHRDLKPTNILIDLFSNIKLIDFGISKIMGLTYKANQTLRDMMTVAYASPEQLLRGNIGYTSDFYSMGCLMYFLFTEQDPPEDKSLLLRQVGDTDCSPIIRQLLHDLLQADSDSRPQQIYQIINVVRSEYIQLVTKSTKLFIKMNGHIPTDLYNIGKLKQISVDGAINFIAEDLETSHIYKHNNSYYLIGDSIKYQCKLSPDRSHLFIGTIHSLEDDYNLQERELKRGFRVYAKWTVLKQTMRTQSSDALEEILTHVSDEERRRTVRRRREEDQNKLLEKWTRYLEEERLILQRKKKLCNYTNIGYDPMSGMLLVTIDDKDVTLEKDDLIQLTEKHSSSQITVGVVDSIVGEIVTVKVKPNVDYEELSPRGKLGLDEVQAEASLKRLVNATRALMNGTAVNPNLIDIVREPELATMNHVVSRNDFIQQIDSSNKLAVNMALATKDVFLIQGPPGTGKTTVITEIVHQILRENPDSRILLSSQSHVAVDHALTNISRIIGDKKIIRIGRLDKIAEESESLLMTNQVNSWVEKVRAESKDNFQAYLRTAFQLTEEESNESVNQLLNFQRPDGSELVETSLLDEQAKRRQLITSITREWHRRLGNLDEFDEIFATNASVVAATCLGIASRHILNDMVFDWVIVDEAARATAPELLVPLVRGKKTILVGDHRQLPPVVNSGLEQYKKEESVRTSDLEKSLFEDLFEKISEDAKVVLTSQFRMHPNIGQLINDVFYPTESIVSRKSPDERKHYMVWWPKSIVWLNTHGLRDSVEQNIGVSKRNETEARTISKLLREIDDTYATQGKAATVAVISGYDAQRTVLLNLIQPNEPDKWKNIKILVNNVDAFQGSETDIAIYSLVRNNSQGKLGFVDDARRLNVALSRGRTCLIIVGNAHFAERAKVFGMNPFVDVLSYIRNNPKDCVMEDVLQ